MLGAHRAERIHSLADELTGSGGKALAVTTDITQLDQVKRLVDATVQTYSRIEVMLSRAGAALTRSNAPHARSCKHPSYGGGHLHSSNRKEEK